MVSGYMLMFIWRWLLYPHMETLTYLRIYIITEYIHLPIFELFPHSVSALRKIVLTIIGPVSGPKIDFLHRHDQNLLWVDGFPTLLFFHLLSRVFFTLSHFYWFRLLAWFVCFTSIFPCAFLFFLGILWILVCSFPEPRCDLSAHLFRDKNKPKKHFKTIFLVNIYQPSYFMFKSVLPTYVVIVFSRFPFGFL